MDIILDTHTIIWFFESDPGLSKEAKRLIMDPMNQNFVSVTSIWEMVIKEQIGKLSLSKPVTEITQHIQRNGIGLIEIATEHVLKVRELDMFHKDAFDRIIIAQSISLNLPIVGKDEVFDQYMVNRLW